MKLIRVWIPVALCCAGVVVIIAGGFTVASLEVGIPIFSCGASVWLINFLYRVGVSSDKDRDSEESAREHYARHGRWPADDEPRTGEPHRGGR